MTVDKSGMEVLTKLVDEAMWKLDEVRAVQLVRYQRDHNNGFVLLGACEEERAVLKALIQTAIEHICAAVATSELALAVPAEEPTT